MDRPDKVLELRRFHIKGVRPGPANSYGRPTVPITFGLSEPQIEYLTSETV